MNGRPIIWAFATVIVTFALRRILARLENGQPILSKLSAFRRLWPAGLRGTTGEGAQELIVTIRLYSGGMGDREERGRIIALEHELSAAIENASAGEFDGDEYGGGICTMYMYGPSAERLLAVTSPILKDFHAPSGSYVIKRCGSAAEDERRIPLDA
ncbi:MAG: hypothetical protein DMG80_04980 [Acidobacteria bacterium]|nr:MAG: hypothetical protein DMG80_04980 [Acidobacteriota bacterium]